MVFYSGPMPDFHDVRAVPVRIGLRILLLAAGLLLAAQSGAQSRSPLLSLAEAEDLALAVEPGREALLARASALEERAALAEELPDPVLRVGLNNFPIESGGFRTEGMTHAAIGLRQEFPSGRSRLFQSRQFDSLATESSEAAEARRRDVLTAVRQAWLELYYWEQAHRLVSETRPIFDDLATVTRSLYAVGRKSQQDVLRAELELTRLQDRLIDIERQRSRAQASLAEWVGVAAVRSLALGLPAWDRPPGLESLRESLQQHPLLRAVDAQIAARGAGVDLARERSRPGWSLDLGYSYREGVLPSGEPRSDFISLAVSVDLPFFRKEAVDRTLSAALRERSAAESDRERTVRTLNSRLEAEYAHWRHMTRRLSLYDSSILDQARDGAEASLLAYQSDQGDFADVMRASIDYLNTRIDHIRLQAERAQSYAVLANLGGLPR